MVDIDERRPPRPAVSFQVQAILAEALRNVFDHARAGTVAVTGVVDWDQGKIDVTDDGIGFDPSAVGDGHFGIIGMRERAAKIDGVVSVATTPGRGTSVSVHWGPT
jgi:signal transduction histidine kinase